MKSTITGWGKCSPDNIMTNDDLAVFVDTSDEWIQQRTGIQERRFCHVNNSDMAAVAGQHAIACAGLTPEDIDVVILATCTPDSIVPSAAAHVQRKLGAVNASVYDINAACAGFVYALEQGKAFVESGLYKRALVIGSEHITWLLDWSDRNTAVLFGDGAGAVLIEPSETNGIIDSKMKIDGDGGKFLYMPGGGSLNPATEETVKNNMHFVKQDGASVFKNAVKGMTDITSEIMNNNNLSNNNINLFIAHQANKRIIDLVAKKLKFNEAQTFINIDKYANTTAATIPIALYDALNSKRLHDNDNIILTTFGAGFTWGSNYMKWNIHE